MSEVTEQATDIKELAGALGAARIALQQAEHASKAYAEAVISGKAQIDRAREAELISAHAIAQANTDAASSALKAAAVAETASAKQSSAARQLAEYKKEAAALDAEAAKVADAAWKAADERGRIATLVAQDHARAVKALEPGYRQLMPTASGAGAALRSAGEGLLAFGQLALPAIGAIGAVVHVLGGASSETARHERALRSLGDAYHHVEMQTRGAVSAEDALRAQGVITNSNLTLTGEQLGLVTRAAREASLATGIELHQALEQLTEGLSQGSLEQLRRFGITVQQGSTRQQTFNSALEQLNTRFRGTAPAATQADEAVEQFNRAAKDAANAGLAALGAGLLSGYDSFFRFMGGAEGAAGSLRAFVREMRDAQGPDDNANSNRALQRIQEVRQQYELQRRAFQSSSLLEGSNIELPNVARLTMEQREQMVQLFSESNRLSVADFRTRAQHILDLQNLQAAAATQQREQSELQRRVDAVNAADRSAHANDDLGMLRAQAERVGVRVNMQQQSVSTQSRLNFLQRELGRLLQDEAHNRVEISKTLGEIVQLRQAENASASEWRQHARDRRELVNAEEEYALVLQRMHVIEGELADNSARFRDETRIEYLHRVIAAQREANRAQEEANAAEDRQREQERADEEALETMRRDSHKLELVRDSERREAFRESGRQAMAQMSEQWSQERHRLLDATSIETQVRQQFGFAEEHVKTIEQTSVAAAKNAYDAFGELGAGIVKAMAQASASGEDMGAAIAKQVDDWAGAKAIQWGLQSAEAFAGAGVAWFIRPDAVPGLLASGASYAALAAVAGVTAAAIPNAPAASAGSGVGGKDQGFGLAASSRSTSADMAQQAPIVFNISGFTSTESAQEGVVRAFREAQSRGLDLGFLR
jgi:hypothetical protein